MVIKMSNMELLAPAGAMAQLKAAVQSGADAVYLGAGSFSARAGAGNFLYDELNEAVKYCHIYGVKVHCAVNTLIKECEFQDAIDTVKMINKCGVDAIIVQDLGLASYIKKAFPDMELHASTQMTVTSIEGVKYLEEMGFDRVVLARELSIDEIKKITSAAKAEIEVFVHGAICMSYSGQCLMSSILGGRSGNRGRCAQPCRRFYELLENGVQSDCAYALSPKDMALVKHLKELNDIGVASLKIEGRLKSPEYVSAVTGVYRKYLDNGGKVSDEDMLELKNAFSRSGFTDGYLTGKLGAKMMSHKNPANNSGSTFTDEAKLRSTGNFIRKIPINIFASLADGDVLRVTAYDYNNNYVSCEGSVKAEKAINKPLTEKRLIEQLSKLGSSPFSINDISCEVDKNITIPVREINEIRRKMSEELENARSKRDEKREIPIEIVSSSKDENELYLTADVMTKEQAAEILKTDSVKRIFMPADIAQYFKDYSGNVEIVTKTTDIFKPERICTDTVSISSPAALYYYGEKAVYGDFRLNIYNSQTAQVFSGLKCITLSPELNLHEIRDITNKFGNTQTEIIGYGHLPLMIMRNCPVKALGKCQKYKNIYSLRDEKGMEFKIICGDGCRAILLNSKPVFIADIIETVKKSGIDCIRLSFTVENSEQCGKILGVYHDAIKGIRQIAPQENTFTRGHLKRGVL